MGLRPLPAIISDVVKITRARADEMVDDKMRRQRNLRAASARTVSVQAAAQDTRRRGALVNTLFRPCLSQSEDMTKDVLYAVHPVPKVARAAVCFMKGTGCAGMSARGVCREASCASTPPTVPDCNRIHEMAGSARPSRGEAGCGWVPGRVKCANLKATAFSELCKSETTQFQKAVRVVVLPLGCTR
jgi:hypothetical protein